MKILYVTTVGATMGFFKSFIRQRLDSGDTVDIACNDAEWAAPDCYREWGCNVHQIDCSRSPLSPSNLKAVGQIKRLVSENGYDIVHCHTPVAALCARLACRRLRKTLGVKVIYTAHGFHFFKGAPKKNWLMFYPLERICAHWTDVLITINKEDFALAQKRLRAKRVEYVSGVGIDIEKFRSTAADRSEKRKELGVPEDAFLLLSVGELNANKNHELVLRAMAKLKDARIYFAIAGKGELDSHLRELAASLGLPERLKLLGYRQDVPELYKTADLFVHPSFREGLPVSVMEAIAAQLPVRCSDIRGARDLVGKERLFDPKSADSAAEAIAAAMQDGGASAQADFKNLQSFDISRVIEKMNSIYSEIGVN